MTPSATSAPQTLNRYLMKILGLLLLLCCHPVLAADGVVYPESTPVKFSYYVAADTITITLTNSVGSKVSNLVVTDALSAPCQLLTCTVDGVPVADVEVETAADWVLPGLTVTRFYICDFYQTLTLKYFSPEYHSGNAGWTAGLPTPVFSVTDSVSQNCCIGLRGNINGDASDQVDVSDLVYLVRWSFDSAHNPAPPCLEEADYDGSGTVDVYDIVRMARWMFNQPGATPPVACD